jgi:predicted GIY-YIG superfamily endonuclease
MAPGVSKKYGIKMLVYYEIHDDINAVIQKETLVKKW